MVEWLRNHWQCECPDFQFKKNRCKHIFAIHYLLATEKIKHGLTTNKNEGICPKCQSKIPVIKRGKSYNRSGTVQRYYCKNCNKRFQGRISFKNMKHRAEVISSSLDLYFRGLSLRQIVQHLQDCHQTIVSHTTIQNWIKRYVKLVNTYLDNLTLESSDRWHADETLIRLKGRHIRLWTLLDSESRFLLAIHLSFSRGVSDADQLLKNGIKKTKGKPLSIVTDGCSSYNAAISKNLLPNTDNLLIHLQGPLSAGLNNKMERYNGVLKTRTKTMFHLKNEETAKTMINGFNIYYNFIKPHSSLQNKTPAETIGITNKKLTWLNLLQETNKL